MPPNARVQGAATASVAPPLRLPWNAMILIRGPRIRAGLVTPIHHRKNKASEASVSGGLGRVDLPS